MAMRGSVPDVGRVFGLVLVFAGGCGGGGGAGGGAPAASGIAVSPATLTFSSNQDDVDAPPPQAVTVTALGGSNLGSTLYAKLDGFSGAVRSADLSCPGGPTCSIAISLEPAYQLVEPGVVTGSVTVLACPDPLCSAGPVPNGTQTIAIQYNVLQGFTVTPHGPLGLVFEGAAGSPPAAQTITLSEPRGALPAWSEQTDSSAPWLQVTPASAQAPATSPFMVTVSVIDQPVGTYETSITFRYSDSPRSITVPVHYTVH